MVNTLILTYNCTNAVCKPKGLASLDKLFTADRRVKLHAYLLVFHFCQGHRLNLEPNDSFVLLHRCVSKNCDVQVVEDDQFVRLRIMKTYRNAFNIIDLFLIVLITHNRCAREVVEV